MASEPAGGESPWPGSGRSGACRGARRAAARPARNREFAELRERTCLVGCLRSRTRRPPPLNSLVPTPEWGDVPAWLQGAAEAGALYFAVRGRRQQQAIDWARTLKELSGLSEEDLRRIVEDNPAIAELVYIAWQAGAETADDHKRYLLAKVAAAALSGATTPEQIEPLQFLLRTLRALDPPHITLLVIIGKRESLIHGASPDQPRAMRAKRDDLEADWPGPEDLMDAALTTLEGLNLIENARLEEGTEGRMRPGWRLRPYGRRFLNFLLIDAGGWPPAERATSTPANPHKPA